MEAKKHRNKTVKEWAKILGLKESTIRARISRGDANPFRPRKFVRPDNLTAKRMAMIAADKGTLRAVAYRHGVSRTTVMNIRRKVKEGILVDG